jgi:hypothetical protein
MERVRLIRVGQPASSSRIATHRVLQQQNNSDIGVKNELANQFIESCIQQLTPSENDSAGQVSQVQYASFVIRYCRDETNKSIRGSTCTSSLFFFPDLPIELQLEFVRYTPCVVSQDTTEDMTREDCLANYNDSSELFFLADINEIPNLCNATFPLMISTDLLMFNVETNAPIATITSQPTISIPSAPTFAPVSIMTTQHPTTIPIRVDSSGLSSVGILGITITILFAIMFGSQCVLWQYRKHQQLHKKRQNDVMALQEDESIVASEHSHELQLPITDDIVEIKSTTSSSGNPKYTTPRFSNKSSRYGSSSDTHSQPGKNHRLKNGKFVYPPPLVTRNLSENNPVNTRKRFSNKPSSGNFPFDEDAMKRVSAMNSDTSSTVDETQNHSQHIQSTRPTTTISTTPTLNVNTKMKASDVSTTMIEPPQPPRPIVIQSGKENSRNTKPQQQQQQERNEKRMGSNNDNSTNHNNVFQPPNKNERTITAVTFGNVIHTELKRNHINNK